ncbi:MAG: hypothetical protein AB1425_00190 [Actinomycetota bacterium]
MNRREITAAFESAGWKPAESGDPHVLIGTAGGYVISTRDPLWQAAGTLFELRDDTRDIRVGVRRVPEPSRAAELLERYGVRAGASIEAPAEPPMVPPEAEM